MGGGFILVGSVSVVIGSEVDLLDVVFIQDESGQ